MTERKKLIEVALPLEAINVASAHEKLVKVGKPTNLHLWWARRPLATARAVIFAQMVDDPSGYVDVLRADPRLHRKAESALKARLKLWDEARSFAVKAKGSGLPVPEPGPAPTLDEILADQERQRLFRIIEDLVLWENTANEKVLQAARDEIWQSWRRACAENADDPRAKELFDRKRLPAFHDPFAGGGVLPLEAQRLGLESYASDLNPVAVLITKALIEIPPKFAGKPPVNPEARAEIARSGGWHGRGAAGLAEDVRYYGQWVRTEAEKRIGHLYPQIEITSDMAIRRPDLKSVVGQKLKVIAWIWARTVKSPNPAFASVDVPLVSNFILSTKAGKEAYIEPLVERGGYRFSVKVGKPKNLEGARRGTKSVGSGSSFVCLMSETPMPFDYLRAEGKAGRVGSRLMAIVADGARGRVYLSPTDEMEAVARRAKPDWKPDVEFFQQALGFRVGNYGMTKWSDLFTSRQLVALTTLSDLVQEARERAKRDALAATLADDGKSLAADGNGASAYADALTVFLGLVLSRVADWNNSLSRWESKAQVPQQLFGRQTISMTWDYSEANPLSDSTGSFIASAKNLVLSFTKDSSGSVQGGHASQADACTQSLSMSKVVSTDPPYYDNIGYADLSDFFYVWLRRTLKAVAPDLFATMAVPKAEELVATPDRHGGRDEAEVFFLDGMTKAMHRLAQQVHPAFPVTIYYAFKQSETDSDEGGGTASTGWETFIEAVIRAGFAISGTWPMRTENDSRMIGQGNNALVRLCQIRS